MTTLRLALAGLALASALPAMAAEAVAPVAPPAPPARPGEASTALSQCLAQSATPADRTALVRWIFASLAAHPALGDLGKLEPAKLDKVDSEAGRVFERLIATDCATQARVALRQDGMTGYQTAFKTLGEVAMQDFVTQKDVAARMGALGKHVDTERLLRALIGP